MLNSKISGIIKVARGLGIAVIVLIYALLVHHVNSAPQPDVTQSSLLGTFLALAPICLILITFALSIKSRFTGASLLLLFSVLTWILWSFIKQNTGLIFWLLDVGLMLALMWTFGRTLLHDRKPLCVHFAEIINGGTLPKDHEMYARNVTIAWVIFFAVITIISTLLFFAAPLKVWSFFVNFLTLPLVALMFAVEFFVRKRLLTNLPKGNVMDAVHAYLDKSARTP